MVNINTVVRGLAIIGTTGDFIYAGGIPSTFPLAERPTYPRSLGTARYSDSYIGANALTREGSGKPICKFTESTLSLAADPYGFISKTCRRCQSDLFSTRLLLQKAICMTGRDAAELLYDESRFQRRGATPGRIQKTLFGTGGIQNLDDEEHRNRKAMLMSLITPPEVQRLVEINVQWWHIHNQRWASADQVVLYDALHPLLCQTVCEWAGVPLPENEVETRSSQLMALFDYAGSVGPKHWRARLARKAANEWASNLVDRSRSGRFDPENGTVLATIAHHRGLNGELLDRHVAGVELLNILRPTVANSVFITLAALALHEHPDSRQRVESDAADDVQSFVQEVRRFYPFFPFVGAKVRKDFEWRGYRFQKGVMVLLDLYGTNHDERLWNEPHHFRPDRFLNWDDDPFAFIPQGGGQAEDGHRCPGEPITIALMKAAVTFLTQQMSYNVPDQDLRIKRRRLPALPASKFVINNVRAN